MVFSAHWETESVMAEIIQLFMYSCYKNTRKQQLFFDIILFIILFLIFMTTCIDWFDLETSLNDLLDTILVYLCLLTWNWIWTSYGYTLTGLRFCFWYFYWRATCHQQHMRIFFRTFFQATDWLFISLSLEYFREKSEIDC